MEIIYEYIWLLPGGGAFFVCPCVMEDTFWLVVGGGGYILAGGEWWWMLVDGGEWSWVVAYFSLIHFSRNFSFILVNYG